jgi:tRNA(Ile)-lysidine synthase
MTSYRRSKTSAKGAGPFSPARWHALARAVGIGRDAPVVIALSGGADSVYLLHVLAAARPRPRILAVHVDHGLRGDESDGDARFSAELCRRLEVEHEHVKLRLDASAGGLEARAREARYAALCATARARKIGVIATGHHADDALETLLQRWIRGTPMEGIAGLSPSVPVTRGMRASSRGRKNERVEPPLGTAQDPLVIVRPLLALRSQEIRRALLDHGIAWREDSSNKSDRFARNRVRNTLLPHLESLGGPETIENLRAFKAAVEELEERCAALTASLAWSPPVHAAARRGADDADLGGSIARALLMQIARPLQRRALWRLITEGAGKAPSRSVLEHIVADLESGRCGVHTLDGGWKLRLRSDMLLLEPPQRATSAVKPAPTSVAKQHVLFEGAPSPRPGKSARLAVPGSIAFEDGRAITADVLDIPGSADVLRSPLACELDLERLDPKLDEPALEVRFPRPGDRFHGLGAPGSKPLSRFLADAGVPREGRARVPIVVSGREVLWVAGIRPCHRARVSSRTRRRLVLRLLHPRADAEGARARSSHGALPFD